MARESEKIPSSRARRTATVATLAASEAVKQFGTRAANVARGEEAAEAAMARRQLETAKPIVAASIGQVYRARLHDGRDVAVKVQYPGVAGAVRADLQNLEMIMRLLKRMTPGLDVKAIAEEIRERIGEELDYELEAQNQRSLARIYAGHPFIYVPDVVSSLSRERVLVCEYGRGVGFDTLRE